MVVFTLFSLLFQIPAAVSDSDSRSNFLGGGTGWFVLMDFLYILIRWTVLSHVWIFDSDCHLVMLWLYFCMYLLLAGAEINVMIAEKGGLIMRFRSM